MFGSREITPSSGKQIALTAVIPAAAMMANSLEPIDRLKFWEALQSTLSYVSDAPEAGINELLEVIVTSNSIQSTTERQAYFDAMLNACKIELDKDEVMTTSPSSHDGDAFLGVIDGLLLDLGTLNQSTEDDEQREWIEQTYREVQAVKQAVEQFGAATEHYEWIDQYRVQMMARFSGETEAPQEGEAGCSPGVS